MANFEQILLFRDTKHAFEKLPAQSQARVLSLEVPAIAMKHIPEAEYSKLFFCLLYKDTFRQKLLTFDVGEYLEYEN